MSDSVWQTIDECSASPQRGYIAISGNTGSGKSTLIRQISAELNKLGLHAIGVNERALHHPLLPQMFLHPSAYALPIQVNFLVQRALLLMRGHENGHLVVLERSHYDDRLFVEDHFARGNISKEELDTYLSITRSLHQHIPEPDIFVLLDTSPATSFQRIGEAEINGERPREFPTDAVKRSYIDAWHDLYQTFFDQLREAKAAGRFPKTKFVEFSEQNSLEDMVGRVVESWQS